MYIYIADKYVKKPDFFPGNSETHCIKYFYQIMPSLEANNIYIFGG